MKSPLQKLALIVIIVLTAMSCGNKKNTQQEEIEIENKEVPTEARAEKAAHDEVMRVHDEAMMKLEQIMNVKGKLQEQLDMLRESEDTTNTAALEDAIKELENADESMMQWMRNFNEQDTDSVSHEEVMKYYEEQQKLIEDVHEQMKAAIAEGRDLTNK